jgi:excinuclease ABC subunit C
MGIEFFVKTSKLKRLKFVPWEHEVIGTDIDTYLSIMKNNKLGGGIYRMYDAAGTIIYVGKSNDIHRRLLEHIGKRSNTAYFIEEVRRIEYFIENDPAFQTMLEGIFIAYHEPRYNDEIKDRSKLK